MRRGDCEVTLRTGPCVMEAGHRGRHTTVAWCCDGCGTMRRSRPVAVAINPFDGAEEAAFCFMCIEVEERDRFRRRRA